MKREAVRYKEKIIMDSVRENLCSKTGVKHCVVPILIRSVGKPGNMSGSAIQHAVVCRDDKWLGMRTCMRNGPIIQLDHGHYMKHLSGSTSCA